KHLTEELQKCANMTTISVDLYSEAINILNTNVISNNDETYIVSQDNTTIPIFTSANSNVLMASETKLDIENIVDLTLSCFSFSNTNFDCEKIRLRSKLTSIKGHDNMDFEASNIVDKVLGIEIDND
ncbi:9719_t:CDS:1, partial [Scutellospora calospora]